MKRVLVVVDYQKDFVDGSLGFLQSENIAPEIYSLVVKATRNKDLVVFTKDTHYENYLSTREGKFLPVKHCIKGTDGHRLYGELEAFEDVISPDVIIVEKETFGSDKLCNVIEEAFNGEPDVIEFCGVVTNICVLSNVVLCQTHFKNAEIIVHEDATAAVGNSQTYAIEVLKGLGVKVV
ncbi:MAG: cysteine hydrolase family protein [Oscillospiraceae bacterium]|nr:cysteine hydrolase family protein [Oscillospiraceae bacterium]